MKGLKPEEFQNLILSVGIHRKKRVLSPYECGQLFSKAESNGNSKKDCAKAVGISDVGTIAHFIRLLDIIPSYTHLVDWGKTDSTIGFVSAAMLAKLSVDDQEIAFLAALEKKLKKNEIEQILQLKFRSKNSDRSINECIEEVVAMRPVITELNVIIGAISSDSLRVKLSILPQTEKDELLKNALINNYPNLQKFSTRLGNDKFTVTVSDDDANYLRSKAKNLEDKITDSLESLI